MSDAGTTLSIIFALYALGMTLFLILENRRPQATLAWMFIFFIAPWIGTVIYTLFVPGEPVVYARDANGGRSIRCGGTQLDRIRSAGVGALRSA